MKNDLTEHYKHLIKEGVYPETVCKLIDTHISGLLKIKYKPGIKQAIKTLEAYKNEIKENNND